jgi:peptide/nickel transport system ATP-binding protein
MIAMALSTRPKVLLADEPTTALDVTIQAQIIELLREVQRDLQTAVLLITHDLGVVNQMADEIAVMYAGRIIEQGERHQLLSAPQHPYTQGLLAALPGRAEPKAKLVEIHGSVPSPKDWPAGCRFAPRCRWAQPACRIETPTFAGRGEGRTSVACFAVPGAQLFPSSVTQAVDAEEAS